MARNSKRSLSKMQQQKVRGGPTPNQIKNFAIVDDQVLSLKHVKTFQYEQGDNSQRMLDWVKLVMLDTREYDSLVIVMYGQAAVQFCHSGAFIRFTP